MDVGGGRHPEATMTVTKHRTCANCGSRAIPVVYGMQSYDGFQRAERGEIEFGDCVIIEGESPAWKCTNVECGLEFGQLSYP
ncbi:MAG: hypothetical protein QOH69_983 [Actinomycetota bacterium]|jgi:hypothetical protein|nr:hypothetical protein [Actinomycetota bacterium]